MKASHRHALALTTVASLAVFAGVIIAGPIDPPSGAIGPSYKTLTEVEPRTAINSANTPGDADSTLKITQPGSYYLAANLNGAPGKTGIEIAASNVTVDLGGFTLLGVPTSLAGIRSTGSINNIVIRNGTVRSWAQDGIDIGSGGATGSAVADIRAIGNGASGIRVSGWSTVRDCSVVSNSSNGINAANDCVVTNCNADGNATAAFAVGIYAGSNSSILDCTSVNNGTSTAGAYGITTGDHSIVARCTANSNGNVSSNCIGILVGQGSIVDRCVANNNTGSASSSSNCGIYAASGSTVQYSDATLNGHDGIRSNSQCTILSNTCIANGRATTTGAGIRVSGIRGRIEGNHCDGADRGIVVESTGNFIARNTCTQNTLNWDVLAGNLCLVVNGSPSGAITGTSGGVSPGSTDPNANFTQ